MTDVKETAERKAFYDWWVGSGRRAEYDVLAEQAAYTAWMQCASRQSDAQEGGEVAIPVEVAARYWSMLHPDIVPICEPEPGTSTNHLKWMLRELRTMTDFGKAMCWLGFVQGMLIERGHTTVQAERDFTRPFFAALNPRKELSNLKTSLDTQIPVCSLG